MTGDNPYRNLFVNTLGATPLYSITTTNMGVDTNPITTVTNDNIWSGNITTVPYIGDPPIVGDVPYWNAPPYIAYPQFQFPPIKPDLNLLEDGIYDIEGGKIIIKRIKVDKEQLEAVMEKALAAIDKEVIDITDALEYEDREV